MDTNLHLLQHGQAVKQLGACLVVIVETSHLSRVHLEGSAAVELRHRLGRRGISEITAGGFDEEGLIRSSEWKVRRVWAPSSLGTSPESRHAEERAEPLDDEKRAG